MLVALVGNQNCGKSTLFNVLTGTSQHIGNYPGVTVDTKSGYVIGHQEIEVVDLPGIYSLSSFSSEEGITGNFIESNHIDLILNVVDITNLERNLYLTLQLKSLGIPVLVVFNMIDELDKKGIYVDKEKIELYLGDCCYVSSSKCIGIDVLIKRIENGSFSNIEMSFGSIDERYRFVDKVCSVCVSNKKVRNISLDNFFLNRFLAYPIFLLIVGSIFYLSFSSFGLFLSNIVETFLLCIKQEVFLFLSRINCHYIIISLVCDGILTGVFSVLSFIPIIALLFFFVGLLEDSGYMARIAFIMDRPLRNFNLSGKSFIPLLMGFGCSVPSIMISRNLISQKERKLLILLVPFMSCSAKLPVFVMICFSLFPNKAVIVILLLYLIGIFVALCVSFVSRFFVKIDSSFILELPSYRVPVLRNVFMLMLEKMSDFVKKAFTVIFVSSVIVWFLESFTFGFIYVGSSDDSFLAYISKLFVPVFSLVGIGDWRIVSSLITGISAKESIVSTLTMLIGSSLSDVINPLQCFSLLVFILLYMPCFATFSVMKKELNSLKLSIFYMMFYNFVAYFLSVLVYQIGRFIL